GRKPSRLAAETLSSRIKKPDIRQQLWPSILIKPVVAIGRGPYTSTHGPSRTNWAGSITSATVSRGPSS
ncbi:hypothetical protein, partial [Bradyrhizobium sp. 162]|uniref:hypothetical protein n=1 Tax=Bradyrhizobium sp. 162 TaxID=2782635 RepID=UPI001FF80454